MSTHYFTPLEEAIVDHYFRLCKLTYEAAWNAILTALASIVASSIESDSGDLSSKLMELCYHE